MTGDASGSHRRAPHPEPLAPSPGTYLPLEPMLARSVRSVPRDGYLYEPKWDGLRCLAWSDGREVLLRSRHGRPLERYFPELVEAFRAVREAPVTVDGEIVVSTGRGLDFAGALSRIHPAASRVERLRREIPARFIAFDLLLVGGRPLGERPFRERRDELERALGGRAGPLAVSPIRDDPALAATWLARYAGRGVDGVVAKHVGLRYRPGERAMLKVKRARTADCVLAGLRLFEEPPAVASLLLGLYDALGALRHVGVVSQLPGAARARLLELLLRRAVPLASHPWVGGFLLERSPVGRLAGAAGRWTPDMELDWVPLRPDLVCEVSYDHFDVDRFRHPARFVRWRPGRDPRSCTFEQLPLGAADPGELLERT
ncbi:MAG TPA: ATP-dependent DNA ligase [Actinomycetota bacterium]|nr:ATP-dependent DNA ligase [Actinomycetota bacterium]